MANMQGSRRSLAAAIAILLAATLTAELVFAVLNWEYYAARGFEAIEHFLYIALFGFLGSLIAYRRPGNPIGWVLVGVAILRQLGALAAVVDVTLASGTEVHWSHILLRGLWPSGFTFALLAFVFVIFPTGRLPSRRWRPVLWMVVFMGVVDIGFFNVYPAVDAYRLLTESDTVRSLVPMVSWGPLSVDRHVRQLPELGVVQVVFMVMLVTLIALGVWAQIHRLRTGTHEERQQVKWLTPALILWAVGLAATLVGLPFESVILLVIPVPVCMTIAILHYRTFEIDRVISQTIVYGTLSIGIFVVYAVVAAAVGLAAQSRLPFQLAIVVTAVVAFAFEPVRRQLQRIADRWVFGQRPTPLEAVAGFESEVEDGSGTDLSDHLAETIRIVGRLRWASVAIPPLVERTSGDVTDEVELTVEIEHLGEALGRIRCGPKIRGRFNEADVSLVRALASQAALVLSNLRMASRLVHSQETERRRIERNIHDGAQQELVALIAKLSVARTNFHDSKLDESVLVELQQDAAHILNDLRNLAQGIHPTILTDGGLVEAVEDRCKRLPMDVVVDVSAELRGQRFDDHTEGAAYFFVAEGLTNVLKHADATNTRVGIRRSNGRIELEVSDNGTGFDTTATHLQGLTGLSDRMRALGGGISVHSDPRNGTVLKGHIPLEQS